ncbi:hypothetical protein [Streptosporangium sp. G12]
MSPAEDLAAAAARLRDTRHYGAIEGLCGNPELLQLIVNLLNARKPLASWLESWDGIEVREDGPMPDDFRYALKVARAINAPLPPSS